MYIRIYAPALFDAAVDWLLNDCFFSWYECDISQLVIIIVLQDNNTCVNTTDLFELLKAVVDASAEGIHVTENATTSPWKYDWDIWSSIFFIATTMTTIGLPLSISSIL